MKKIPSKDFYLLAINVPSRLSSCFPNYTNKF